MPAVSPLVADPTVQSVAPGTARDLAPPGFAAALQRQTLAGATTGASTRPTVNLGQMVTALVDGAAAATGGATGTGQAQAVGLGAGEVGGIAGQEGHAVMAAAERYLGVPYRWGGTDPSTGLDCSGFVQRVYADLGVSLPRVSVDQSTQGAAVASLEQARPGDLVYWSGSPNHIGIYAGEGRMIVAPRTGDVVRYQTISRTPHAIRRIL